MDLIVFLILFPFLSGLLMLLPIPVVFKRTTVKAASLAIAAASIFLLVTNFHRDFQYFTAESPLADKAIFFSGIILELFVLTCAVKQRRPAVFILMITQAAVMLFTETYYRPLSAGHNLFIDKLSLLMAMVVGVVGSLICIYAVGYMRDFHNTFRTEIKDRRKQFFFLVFLFLSAMFGIVFSNNLLWLYFFWEVTTVCSFLLIGYKGTEESINNSFRALQFNLIGGLGFALALFYLASSTGTIELDKLLALGKAGILIPAALICFAGLTKSAQLPFSSWLLGAMVAPTPVSALLHSSTMVKAGVYIILRFAAALQGTFTGFVLALIGGTTFLIGSFIAITQSDAKRILAYSTVANLGLIVMCAGIGTYEAMWAAMLLIIFHALAKGLLFLCVGTAEHNIKSRNIEDMSGLIITMPKISIMMQIGIAGMFLAPFGMLISKWAVLKAIVDFDPILTVFVVFGSSATLFFWVKWLGKLVMVTKPLEENESHVGPAQWIPLSVLAFLTIAVCGFFPVVSKFLVEPFVIDIYGKTFTMAHGNIVIMSIMLAMVMLFPLSFLNYGKRVKVTDAYLGGANTVTNTQFYGSLGDIKNMEMKNYYLEAYFGEKRLFGIGVFLCSLLSLILLAASCL